MMITVQWPLVRSLCLCGGVAILAAAGSAETSAALVRHWKLDELTLPQDFSGAPGEVVDSTGNSSQGRLFGYAIGASLSGVIGVPGPAGFGTAFNFAEATGITTISGVFTNSLTAVPATGDFSIVAVVRTTNLQTAQGHIFSNNNGQAGRANLHIQNGALHWFTNGGQFDTNNDSVSDGDLFSSSVASVASLFDGNWHQVSMGRSGNRFDIALDGAVVASGVSVAAMGSGVVMTQTQSWMIGRQRSSAGDFEGEIADVKVFDTYAVPEPASAVLALLGPFAACGIARLRRNT